MPSGRLRSVAGQRTGRSSGRARRRARRRTSHKRPHRATDIGREVPRQSRLDRTQTDAGDGQRLRPGPRHLAGWAVVAVVPGVARRGQGCLEWTPKRWGQFGEAVGMDALQQQCQHPQRTQPAHGPKEFHGCLGLYRCHRLRASPTPARPSSRWPPSGQAAAQSRDYGVGACSGPRPWGEGHPVRRHSALG